MKKLFSVAALAACLLSFSSFTTADTKPPVHSVTKRAFSFPITGTTPGTPGAGQPAGYINYSISGGGSTPYAITFTTASGTSLGTYPFNMESSTSYVATGMKSQTLIQGVYFRISSACTVGYCLEFISIL